MTTENKPEFPLGDELVREGNLNIADFQNGVYMISRSQDNVYGGTDFDNLDPFNIARGVSFIRSIKGSVLLPITRIEQIRDEFRLLGVLVITEN